MYRSVRQQPSGSNFLQDRARRTPKKRRRNIIGSVVVLIAIALTTSLIVHFTKNTTHTTTKASTPTAGNNSNGSSQPAASSATDGFNKSQYSTTNPASIWIIVNKQHPLTPKTYAPKDLVAPTVPMRSNITGDERLLRTEPAKALETMIQAATDAGVHLNLQSGYRSYNLQVGLYNSYVKQQGRAAADRSSARPGYSEHQTGLAADLGGTTQPVCNVADCYADTIEGKWLAANAYRYGFIVRYTSIKESITGYEYEPWHVRYIGASLAAQMRTTGIETLEEFFSVTGGTAY